PASAGLPGQLLGGEFFNRNPDDFFGEQVIAWGGGGSTASYYNPAVGANAPYYQPLGDPPLSRFGVFTGHAYRLPGTYMVSGKVHDDADGEDAACFDHPITVGDAPLQVLRRRPVVSAVEGQATGPLLLATLVDFDTNASPADLSATVCFGNGQT